MDEGLRCVRSSFELRDDQSVGDLRSRVCDRSLATRPRGAESFVERHLTVAQFIYIDETGSVGTAGAQQPYLM
jgi:hypothetical protein